jgi:DNA-binding transcriptional MerR regulator
MRTVGEVSALTGVTVRALHHYDELGLLPPSERSESGYRLYSYEDLARLQEIVGWRALGFSLEEIKTMLDDPSYDRAGALERQRDLVERDIQRLGAMRAALDEALAAQRSGTRLKETQMFDGFDPARYEEEARERWGDTDAYKESARRAASYGEAEWAQIRSESEEIVTDFTRLLGSGEPAGGERARAVAERHRQHISRWFYACPPEMHRRLGEMYVADQRFARTYERAAPGLAAYVRDAYAANADSQRDVA